MRLFVAIELSDEARTAVARCQSKLARQDNDSRVRWTPSQNVHLTIRFLGEVPEAEVVSVSQAVESSTNAVPPFSMRIDNVGCFPTRGKVRIVWVGIEENSGAMARLAAKTESEIVAAGFPPESRPYRPHVTIGRVKDDRSGGDLRRVIGSCAFDGVEQTVDRVVVMASQLSPGGPTYLVVSTHPLGGNTGKGDDRGAP